MTIKKIHSAYAALALAVLLAPACQREDDTQPQRGSVSFTVRTVDASPTKSPGPAPALIPVTGTDEYFLIREETALQPGLHPADAPATKAAIYPEGALQKGAELGLVAYAYAADSAPANTWKVITKPAVTPLILDDSGTGGNRTDGSGKWIPSPSSRLEWPREGFVRYFAYVPYSAVSGTFADNGAPVLDYSVPEAVASQVDLLVSTPESTRQYSGDPGWRNIDVPMVLQHALTGVRFRIVDGLSIDNVTISGIYGAGRLDMSAAALSWTLTGSPDATNTLTDPALVTDPVRDGFKLTNPANTLLLMPQALPADACIEVEISRRDSSNNPVSGTERTIRAVIGGQTWRPGTLVTYTITRVTQSLFEVTYNGVTTSSDGSQANGGTVVLTDFLHDESHVFTVTTEMGYEIEVSGDAGSSSDSADPSAVRETYAARLNIATNRSFGTLPAGSSFTPAPFSVDGSGEVVFFSPGNLQYKASANTWRFAPRQWDFVGFDTYGTVYESGVKSKNKDRSSSYSGWIDLFAWGTSGYSGWTPGTYGSSTSPWLYGGNHNDYGPKGVHDLTGSYAKGDWGVANAAAINSSSGTSGAWRTPSLAEWWHILFGRSGYRFLLAGLSVGSPRQFTVTVKARQNPSYSVRYTFRQPAFPICGIILFPDNFQANHASLVAPYADKINQGVGECVLIQNWDELEAAGCVFLPQGGRVDNLSSIGQYWTSTADSNIDAHSFYMLVGTMNPQTADSALDILFKSFYGSSLHEEDAPTDTNRGGDCTVRLVKGKTLSTEGEDIIWDDDIYMNML